MELFDVCKYGAVGDAVTLNTSAIQTAIDECSESGGGIVYFPRGVFLSGTLTLRSYVTLELSPCAVLLASSNKKDYPGALEKEEFIGSSYFLQANNIEKFRITGQGTIDGNGPVFWTDEVINNVPNLGPIVKPKNYRPRSLMYIVNGKDLHFTDVTFRNSPCFTIWLLGCDRVNIDSIVIDNPQHGPNTDGIDVDCSSNVHISNCHIVAGDDCIALKSDAKRLGMKKACENITVTNCTFSSRACGIRIGYEGDAPIRNCCFSNITMQDTDIGFSIVSIIPNIPPPSPGLAHDEYLEISEGCSITNLNINNIIMDNVNSPVYIWLGKEKDAVNRGCIRDIKISNLVANCNNICCLYGLPENKVKSIEMSDFRIHIQTPIEIRHELPPYECGVWGAWGIPYPFYLRNAEGIHFDNVIIDVVEDWKESILTDECSNISMKDVDISRI